MLSSPKFSSKHCQTVTSDSINTYPDVVTSSSKKPTSANGQSPDGIRSRTAFESKDTTTISIPLIINTEFVDSDTGGGPLDVGESLDVDHCDKYHDSEDVDASEDSTRSRSVKIIEGTYH